jgi:hypothetical protein
MEVATQMNIRIFAGCILLSLAVVSSLAAQAYEISPYGGYYWPGNNNQVGRFANNHTLGVRGGAFITHNVEVGGNYSWSNHFQPSSENDESRLAGDLGFPQGAVRSHLWEAEFSYNFGRRNILGSAVKPYIVVGGGGLFANVRHGEEFVLNVRPVVTPTGTTYVANDVLETKDKFFTFSYGGGIKTMKLWGPLGFFGDLRGRTIPNFFAGHGTNWPELTAGLNIAWGEP